MPMTPAERPLRAGGGKIAQVAGEDIAAMVIEIYEMIAGENIAVVFQRQPGALANPGG